MRDKRLTLVRFTEDKVVKVAPISLVRKGDKSPFLPQSCEDFEQGQHVQVKWQRSLCRGDFNSDGYYDAQLFAIAYSLETIREKAVEAGIKVPQHSPLISLPFPSSSPPKMSRDKEKSNELTVVKSDKRTRKDSKSSDKKDYRKDSKLGKGKDRKHTKSVVKDDCKAANSDRKADQKVKNDGDKKEKHQEAQKDVAKESANNIPRRSKVNKVARNAVFNNRLSQIIKDCVKTNPLMNMIDGTSGDSQAGTPLSNREEQAALTVIKEECNTPIKESNSKPSKVISSTERPVSSEKGKWESEVMSSSERRPHSSEKRKRSHSSASDNSDDDSILLPNGFKKARARKSLFDDPTSPAVSLNGDDNISSSTQIRDNKLDDDTYEPQSPQAQSPDKKPNSDTESSKKQHNGLSWSQTGSPITDDDENVDGFGNPLEDTLPGYKDLKGSTSSEKSSSSSEDSEESEDGTAAALAKVETLETEVSELKAKVSKLERELTLANNLRVAHKEKVSELEGNIKKLEKRNSTLQDLLVHKSKDSSRESHQDIHKHPSSLKHRKGSDKDFKSENATKGSEKGGESNPDKPVKDIPPKKSPKKSPIKNSKKSPQKRGSKKKGAASIDLQDEQLETSCSKVLHHLTGEHPLSEDEEGQVDIGNGVKVKNKRMEQNFVDNKLNLEKAAKNLTAMAWTHAERLERSLEGGRSNKYPDAKPKQQATPKKVNAVLGALKAHMQHLGDKEGPSMALSLARCRKAIGEKLAQDAYNQRRS